MFESQIKKAYNNNLNIFLGLAFIAAFLGKIVEELFLPEKYFYDSDRINLMVENPHSKYAWNTGSYKVAADFFRDINVFHFTARIQWSIFLGVVLTIVTIIMFKKCTGLDTKQIVFGSMCVALCNIYVFNISKDALQFGIFIIIFIVVSIKKLPIWIKAIVAGLLLYWESNVYKSYYIIMAFFFMVIFIAFSIIRVKKKRLRWFQYLIIVIGLYAMVYVFLFSARSLFPSDYKDIMEAREYSSHQGQTSVIEEPFEHDGNLNLFFADYTIDSVRMMFPFELVQIGAFYVPFFAFQVFLLFYLIRGIKYMDELDDKSFIGLCIFLAYFLGSVLFEPDFGSFVRHEAATLPVIILMVFNPTMWDPKVKEQIKMEEAQFEEVATDF